jgi:hypothetical protein
MAESGDLVPVSGAHRNDNQGTVCIRWWSDSDVPIAVQIDIRPQTKRSVNGQHGKAPRAECIKDPLSQ